MYLQADGFSQRDQRSEQMFTDQHGREYHASIEKKTMHPTGPIQPQFRAPLMPPMKYIELSKDRRRPYDLRINYDQWIADLRTGHTEWKRAGEQLAMKVHGDAYDPDRPFTRQVLEVIGPKPQHVEPVIAAKQGNAYVLGLTDRVDIRLAAMLEEDKPVLHIADEPDFSEVVESLDDDDLDALDDAEEKRKEAIREKDRQRKAAKREARRQAAEAA